ncbi:MAG: polysaccharide pyruvyl transferase family protein, partial [Aeoliella sp.]
MVRGADNDGRPSSSLGDPPTVAVLGATPGTGNLGVDALAAATVQGLLDIHPQTKIYLQSWVDHGPILVDVGSALHRCEPLIIRRREHTWQRNGVSQLREMASRSPRFAGLLPKFSPTWSKLNRCHAVLDISAGDSFADIYGDEVFWYQSQLKLMCLDLSLPLVLLPQTFGPFNSDESRAIAADIVSRSRLVCTREADGIDEVNRLCAGRPGPRITEAPDVAFLLDAAEAALPDRTDDHIRRGGGPVIAINISGLLYFARKSFELATSHSALMGKLVDWALSQEGARVLLVPHVIDPSPNDAHRRSNAPTPDSTDTHACLDL